MTWRFKSSYPHQEIIMDANQDKRNVVDDFRGMSVESIKQELDQRRIPLEIAVENLTRDFNMGTIVRTANAFNVSKIHVIGRRQWNKRGAMATDKYMNVFYHATIDDFLNAIEGKKVIAIDIVPGASELGKTKLPRDTVLVFGAEGPGISEELLSKADSVVMIEQFGSTRSVNVGVAAGIAMYTWLSQHLLNK